MRPGRLVAACPLDGRRLDLRADPLTFPNWHFDRERGHELYYGCLDELEYADRLGFDGYRRAAADLGYAPDPAQT